MTSKFKLKHIIGSVLAGAFFCRIARVAPAIGTRVIDWGAFNPRLAGGGVRRPHFFAAPYFLYSATQARQIFSTCHKQSMVCTGWVKNKIDSFFFWHWDLNDVMRSHCHSVTLGTLPDLDLDPYLHTPALIRLLYLTFWTNAAQGRTRSLGYILVRPLF